MREDGFFVALSFFVGGPYFVVQFSMTIVEIAGIK
jgi:hypothetical protein